MPPASLTESPGLSTFVRDQDGVYLAYSTTWRGLEFLMGYYPILDRGPRDREEGEAWQLWLRRHDEYDEDDGGAAAPGRLPVAAADRGD